MSVLNQIAYLQGRRDEAPNQELARRLVESNDRAGIAEIADNLWNADPNIQSDCLKVLYEAGSLQPELIAPYTGDFLKLLHSKNNRLVWGAMIALAAVAQVRADELYAHRQEVMHAMAKGSVITVDNGVKVIARVAAQKAEYNHELFPFLLAHLESCRSKDVPQHAESSLVAVNPGNVAEFTALLEKRLPSLSGSQAARVRKVIQQAGKM